MSTSEIASNASDLGPVLVRAGGPNAHVEAVLRPSSRLVVGSGASADLVIAEPTVSQRHLCLEHRGTHVTALDLGSRNGTTLYGQRVANADLGPGVRLGLGHVVVDIVASDEAVEDLEPLPGLIGTSRPMVLLAQRVRRFAALSEAVLLRGESGTGKELVARAVHQLSKRAGAFVALNGASLSRELAESELFGHKKGAFTGAMTDRRGAFREAHGGTLFIDEVAQLSLDVQAKLLRAVEERVVRPLGSDTTTAVDVRIVAATCEPLEEYVAQRKFRADLYERIAVCIVHVPSLRERVADIPKLAAHLLGTLNVAPHLLTRCGLLRLESGDFRGNVRELRSVLLHASVAAGSGCPITAEHVSAAWRERSCRRPLLTPADAERIVQECGGNITEAARRLGVPRSTLRDRLAHAKGTVKK